MTVQTGTATGVGSQQRVFIIHGRNKSPARKLKELLADRFNLAGVILVDMGGSSLTIIEKFEDEASLCRYAFAVFTPDDFVQARDGEQYYQMRPNVLFELGWCFAFAKMGRSRTCILCKKGTNIPSDLRGIFFLEFTRSITQIEDGIRIELEKAGLAVTSPEDPDVEPGH
jgi:predicted nucleotide-binding protein